MKLTQDQVEKIALLSRLDLTQEEKELYSKQLSLVFEYFEKLKDLDVKDLPITAQVTGLENVYRKDETEIYDETKELIEMAPDSQDNMIKTKSVFK